MEREFEILKIGRNHLLKLVNKFTDEELMEIPDGFNNNILWNAGHIITSQQRLCYGMSGLELTIPIEYIAFFAKGTSPRDWKQTPDISKLKTLIADTDTIQNDYKKGLFKNYKPYETSYGYLLKSIEDAIAFNNIHEAIHTSAANSLSKLIKKKATF